MRRMGAALRGALAAVVGLALAAGRAAAEPVKPLDLADCADVRHVIEEGLPFVPGFRMLEFDLPKNAAGVEGKVCRLLTVGTGAHMETPEIRSLDDMRALMMGALTAAGWVENDATRRFAEKTTTGRTLFALARKDALCVGSIVVGVMEGANPDGAAVQDGKVRLSALTPLQREWWLALDCFKI
jgi:hypothetical protein